MMLSSNPIQNKMLFICIVFFVLVLSPVFASNAQKTYYNSDPVWIRADRLCMEMGVMGPTPVSPTTGAEIRKALERLDVSMMNAKQKAEYNSIIGLLDETKGYSFESKNISFDPVIELNPELYLFNNTKNTYREEFFVSYKDRKHFLELGFKTGFRDFIFLEFNYPYMDSARSYGINSEGQTVDGPYFYNFSNFSALISPSYNGAWENYFYKDPSIKANHYIMTFQPIKIGASIGNDFCNFFIGRTRQKFGNGVTGNMVLGDTLSYQETMRASVFSDFFSYYLSLTHYDNAEDDIPFRIDSEVHQQRSIHRFDMNFSNRFRFAVNIGAHIVSQNAFDWRMLVPLMIVHNWNNNSESEIVAYGNGDETNNIMGFEFEWAIAKGWRLGAQLVIDQFQLPMIESSSTVPNAFGFLVNAKNTASFDKGGIDSYIEFVYTNPYLYLNKKKILKNGNYEDNYYFDHIAGYSYWAPAELNYLGHQYGPDAIAVSIGSEYHDADSRWNAGGSISYIIHGEKGKEDYRNKENERHGTAITPSGIPEHTLRFDAKGGYEFSKNLSIDSKAAVLFQWNYHNQEDAFKTSLQYSIGLAWTII